MLRDNEIMLECPKCQRRMVASREASDPLEAAKVHIQCPKCNGGDFDTPHYYDADGNEVSAALK